MIPDAHISHRAGQRLRIRIPMKKGDVAYFSLVKQTFSELEGIVSLETNHLTGSVLVIHTIDPATVVDYGVRHGLFALAAPLAHRSRPFSRTIAEDFVNLDRRVRGFTGGQLDIPTLAFLTLVGVGAFQISRGRFAAPAWYTAFWYAMNIFLKGLSTAAEGGE